MLSHGLRTMWSVVWHLLSWPVDRSFLAESSEEQARISAIDNTWRDLGFRQGPPSLNQFNECDEIHRGDPAPLLGMLGVALAVLVFLAPLATMRAVCREGSLGGFDHLPFIAMLAMALLWMSYSFPHVTPCLPEVLACNSIGVVLNVSYLGIFISYADASRRAAILTTTAAALALVAATVGAAVAYDRSGHTGAATVIIGYACVAGVIFAFGSPLAIVQTVIRTRSVRYMPLPLSMAMTLNCLTWTLHGVFTTETFVLVTNAAGLALGILQLIVYTAVACCCTPRRDEGEAAPLKAPAADAYGSYLERHEPILKGPPSPARKR